MGKEQIRNTRYAIDYTQRPSLPPDQLADVTNTLAHWLPGSVDDTAVSHWGAAEWAAAEWTAYWQNGLPWLAQRIRESGAAVPEPVSGRLQTLDAGSRERTRRMLDAAAELLEALAQAGVTGLPFKGAALAPLVYGEDVGLRPLGDLDVLIRKADLAAGIAVLEKLGYRRYSQSAEDVVYLRGERQANIWAADNVQPVELHFTLREEYAGMGYNLAELMWAAGERRPYWANTTACLPDTAALLHHVCAHATSDWLIQRGRLMHIDDIRRLCGRLEEGDWQRFRASVAPRNARFVYPALAFAVRYGRFDVPSSVLAHLRENCPPNLLAWIENTGLADNSEANPVSRSGIGFDLARRLALSRPDEARFWLRSLFPRRWNLSKRYPRLVATPFWPAGYILINLDRARHLARKIRRG